MQKTIKHEVYCESIGIHSGEKIKMKIMPASENTGIVFIRSDLNTNNIIKAHFDNVVNTTLCTEIANDSGAKISTVEHIMAALWGANIDNATIEVVGTEIPGMDGSSMHFTDLIAKAGVKLQSARKKIIQIINPICLKEDDKMITIEPNDKFSVDCMIDFDHKAIGTQRYNFDESVQNFEKDITKARSFGFIDDIAKLQKVGFAKGASLKNAVGIDSSGIMNKEGLRYHDEFVRHKTLDCIGDLYLAGAKIKGKIKSFKAGHKLNNGILRKIFSSPQSYKLV